MIELNLLAKKYAPTKGLEGMPSLQELIERSKKLKT
jgi:hypothetical protein